MVGRVKLFLPQSQLETWASEEKADLKDGKLVAADSKTPHPVVPAIHFVSLASGEDKEKLVGKVKTMTQLDALGAECMMDSVILGDAAYQVVPGYLTEVATAPVAAPAEHKKKPSSPEADLLAKFILDKL